MIIFGFEPDEMRRLLSSMEYSFESNRKILGQLMKSMDHTVTIMDAIDNRCGKLKNVHDEFRRQAMTIPLLWEKNELLLRYLVAPSNMDIRYGISAPTADPLKIETDTDVNIEQQQQQQQNRSAYHFRTEALEVNHECIFDGQEKSKTDTISPPGFLRTSAPPTSSCPLKKCKMDQLSPPSYDSLEQILIHLCRDWSSQGIVIRERLYLNGIIKKLQEYMPIVGLIHANSSCKNHKNASSSDDKTDNVTCCNECNNRSRTNALNNSTRKKNVRTTNNRCCCGITIKKNNNNRNSLGTRVLLPGAGVGRLASEIAVRGYAVEANDCSGYRMFYLSTINLRIYQTYIIVYFAFFLCYQLTI